MKKLSGAEIFIESLKQEQVELVFGYPGGAVLPIFEEFRKSKIKFVMPIMNKLLYTQLEVMLDLQVKLAFV